MNRAANPGFSIQSRIRKDIPAVFNTRVRLAVLTIMLLKVNPMIIPQMRIKGLASRNQVQSNWIELPAIKCRAARFCLPSPQYRCRYAGVRGTRGNRIEESRRQPPGLLIKQICRRSAQRYQQCSGGKGNIAGQPDGLVYFALDVLPSVHCPTLR